jgi:hypothetical protein
MLLVDGARDFGRLAKKVELPSHSTLASASLGASTKSVIVEVVPGLLELITKAVVGVIKVESGTTGLVLP